MACTEEPCDGGEPQGAGACPAGHPLQHTEAPSPSSISCDVCGDGVPGGAPVRCCRPCNYDVCRACVDEPNPEQRRAGKFRQRLRSYTSQAKQYADSGRRAASLRVLPDCLAIGGGGVVPGDRHVRDLLAWFKGSFFRWTNKPQCATCAKEADTFEGMAEPTDEDRSHGASRVEAYACSTCAAKARFPRYNDPARLLESRNGRCGEWANCFTLLLASCGYDCRLVVDWTDHVWSEVFLGDRWLHCDPCEGSLSAPMVYEGGWGKKLTYVVAFSSQEVVDVTPRYVRDWTATLSRRTLVPETLLETLLQEADAAARADAAPPAWRAAEREELAAMREAARHGSRPEELCGRTSGSAEWRAQRGELGAALPVRLRGAPRAMVLAAGADVGDAAGAEVVAKLACGAAVVESDGGPCIDLCGEIAYVELESRAGPLEDAFLSDAGFSVEVRVRADPADLHFDTHRNPVVSRHGPATGWELRLARDGGVVFLVTADGVHHEIQGRHESGAWMHIAASLTSEGVARLHVDGRLLGELALPAGAARSGFDGELLLGRNPAWRDRGARCRVRGLALAWEALPPGALLSEP